MRDMNLPSKIFFLILFIAMGIAMALSYYRYIVRHDFLVEDEAPPEEILPAESEVVPFL